MKQKMLVYVLLIAFSMISTSIATTFAEMQGMQSGAGSQTCEQCGMTTDSVSQSHLMVVDSNGTSHYVECLKCAFKLLPKLGALNITTTCDWYGPNYPITISLNKEGNMVAVNPTSASFIDGNCMKNRVCYNQTALDDLFANNGTSPYLAAIQNVTIASNATIMTVVQAANKYAISPSTSASPMESMGPMPTNSMNPDASPTLATTKSCEACGMDVTPADQVKYQIVDGTGTVHYAECFMCALRILNDYNDVNITTYCDWNGPNRTITVQSTNYGSQVTVTPSTAMFLNGGSCVINRVAYDQTAANDLLANGFSSQYTLPEQCYPMPTGTNVTSVKDAALSFAAKPSTPVGIPTALILIAAVAAIVIVVGAVVAYKKLKS